MNVTNVLESHQPFKRSMANNSNKRKELSNATDTWLSRTLPNLPPPLLTPPSPFSPALVKNKDFRKVFVEGLGVFRNFYFGGDCVGWYHGILIEN